MTDTMKPEKCVPIKSWTKGVPVEEAARKQLANVAQMPFIYRWERQCRTSTGGLAPQCRKDEDVIDETPMAYQPIDTVMEAQKDLVEIVHTLRQVVCVKG